MRMGDNRRWSGAYICVIILFWDTREQAPVATGSLWPFIRFEGLSYQSLDP